jgi:protease-4
MKLRRVFFIGFLLFVLAGLVLWLISDDSEFMASPNRIGIVEVRGAITSPMDTLKAIKKFRKDENIKAIVLRVESPGGGIGPSQEIFRELRRTITEKPVVTSMGGVAASGGYYIAAETSQIVASPGTLTGSIGVISYFPNLQELFDKVGFATTIIKSGQFKDVGNPGRPMTPEEKKLLQETIDEAHRQFVADEALGRNLPEEKVRPLAAGRIIMGQTAMELGLVDEMGNFEDAVNAATRLGKIQGEPTLIYAEKEKISLLDLRIGSDVGERLDSYLEGSMQFLRYQLPVCP